MKYRAIVKSTVKESWKEGKYPSEIEPKIYK